jgi:hypothetical protein
VSEPIDEAERARGRVREEFEQLRVGIERLRSEQSEADTPLFAISAGAERARDRVREEFDQLRAGIEKSLRRFDDARLSKG